MRAKGKTDQEEEYFAFLDAVRESGSINMFGASVPLQEMFGLSRQESHRVLAAWMESFNKESKSDEQGIIEDCESSAGVPGPEAA